MADSQEIDALQDRLNQANTTYEVRFSGKARATRNLAEADALIQEIEDILEHGQTLMNGGDNTALVTILDNARENLQLYKAERAQIADLQSQGAHVIDAAMAATWANFVFDEYHRHYAGKNRSDRDPERLEEMLAELDSISQDMESLVETHSIESAKNDLQAVESNLEMYESELAQIRAARTRGSREERADALARAANEQFRVYNAQFAGKGRSTRRPELLARVIKNLTAIYQEMADLSSRGYRNQSNTRNIQIVRDNLEMYKGEVSEIRKAREGVETPEDMAGMLGGAANDVMNEYRENFAGKERATRDLALLSGICDQMYELAIQMRDIQDELPGLEMNNRNLSIVTDNLILYHTEYRRVEEAKGQGA